MTETMNHSRGTLGCQETFDVARVMELCACEPGNAAKAAADLPPEPEPTWRQLMPRGLAGAADYDWKTWETGGRLRTLAREANGETLFVVLAAGMPIAAVYCDDSNAPVVLGYLADEDGHMAPAAVGVALDTLLWEAANPPA